MIQVLIGLALLVGIITMVAGYWHVWGPILTLLWALCRVLLFLAVVIGGGIWLWNFGGTVHGKNGLPVNQLVAIGLGVFVVFAVVITVIHKAADAIGRERLNHPANMPIAVIALFGGTMAAIAAGEHDLVILAWILSIIAIAGFCGTLFLIYAGGAFEEQGK
jgi:hypothetical protein